MHLRARWYAPYLNRFISPDTIVPNPANPQSLNRYAYAYNNPVKYRDPSGHIVETVWDVANIALGVASLSYNLYEGNYADAAIDAGGLVIDVAAAAIPVVPGGAGAAIKAVRLANQVDNVVDTVNAIDNTVDAVTHIDEAAEYASDGYAIIKGYERPPGGNWPHFTVEVRSGDGVLETEQWVSKDRTRTTIDEVLFPQTPSVPEVTVPLPNAKAAQNYQGSVIGTETGPYGLGNNCVTHVCDVLRAGGAEGVPNPSQGGIRDITYLRELDKNFDNLFLR